MNHDEIEIIMNVIRDFITLTFEQPTKIILGKAQKIQCEKSDNLVSRPNKEFPEKIMGIPIEWSDEEYLIRPITKSKPPRKGSREPSFYGPKPNYCPEKFTHCGDCNIYPCRTGKPTTSEEMVK